MESIGSILDSDDNLRNYYNIIQSNCNRIHKDRVLLSFTDHGIGHSKKMETYLNELCRYSILLQDGKGKLNEIEAFLLLAAVYLHDIGMQIGDVQILKRFASEHNRIFDETQKDSFIRNNHHLLSVFWIENDISGKYNDLFKAQAYVGDADLGKHIQTIVRSHCENIDASYPKTVDFGTKTIRLRLLCILLSLADASDCSQERIDYEKLKMSGISDASKLHWMKHYYVYSAVLDHRVFRICYHFPSGLTQSELRKYRTFFSFQTTRWIKKTVDDSLEDLKEVDCLVFINESQEEDDIKDRLTTEQFNEIEASIITDLLNENKETLCEFQPLEVALGILCDDEKVFLVHRRNNAEELGWQFPAAIIRQGESIPERLRRDILIETGIEVEAYELIAKRIHPKTKAICHYYSVRIVQKKRIQKQSLSYDDQKWFSIPDCMDLLKDSLDNRVETYLRNIIKHSDP